MYERNRHTDRQTPHDGKGCAFGKNRKGPTPKFMVNITREVQLLHEAKPLLTQG